MFGRAQLLFATTFVASSFFAEGCNNPDGKPPGRPFGGTGAVSGCTDATGASGGVTADASATGGVAGSGGAAASGGLADAGGSAAAAGASGAGGSAAAAGTSGDAGPGGAPSAGGTSSTGGVTAATGGCAGSGGGAAGPKYELSGCAFSQSCDQVLLCESHTKLNATTQTNCTGSYAKEACTVAEPVGACVVEVGNQCHVSWPSSSFFTTEKAEAECKKGSGQFLPAGRCDVKMRCDGRAALGTCVDYGAGYTASAVKKACGAAAFAAGDSCPQKDTVGSCLIADGKHCATLWYDSDAFSLSQAREECLQRGGHFLSQ